MSEHSTATNPSASESNFWSAYSTTRTPYDIEPADLHNLQSPFSNHTRRPVKQKRWKKRMQTCSLL